MNISRLKHSFAVASKMRDFVASHQEYSDATKEDMFYLGILHDIAYEFASTQLEHGQIGGNILRDNGYKYWQEVYNHGNPDSIYTSKELDLLNYMDLTTGPNGENFSIEQRLADIAIRYGTNSIQYKKAEKLSIIIKPVFSL